MVGIVVDGGCSFVEKRRRVARCRMAANMRAVVVAVVVDRAAVAVAGSASMRMGSVRTTGEEGEASVEARGGCLRMSCLGLGSG